MKIIFFYADIHIWLDPPLPVRSCLILAHPPSLLLVQTYFMGGSLFSVTLCHAHDRQSFYDDDVR